MGPETKDFMNRELKKLAVTSSEVGKSEALLKAKELGDYVDFPCRPCWDSIENEERKHSHTWIRDHDTEILTQIKRGTRVHVARLREASEHGEPLLYSTQSLNNFTYGFGNHYSAHDGVNFDSERRGE